MAKVLETLPNAMFRVELEEKPASGAGATSPVKCVNTSSEFFRVIRVLVELSPYDLNRGRITYRYK